MKLNIAPKKASEPSHLPTTSSQSRTGEVSSISRVPWRRSSASTRIVVSGTIGKIRRNAIRPKTLSIVACWLPSSGSR